MADGWRDVTEHGDGAWEACTPGPRLAAILAEVDPQDLSESARVSYLRATDRLAGWAHVLQARALVAVSDAVLEATSPGEGMTSSLQFSAVADEIAAALHVAPRTASTRVNAAESLVRDWPVLGSELAAGNLTVAQARTLAEEVQVLAGARDEDGVDLAERAIVSLLPIASTLPPARLRERAARAVTALDGQAAARRRQAAQRERTDVSLWAEADGIACIAARGPAADAVAMRDLIDERARALRERADNGDERTAGQWRHAALLAALGLMPVGASPRRSQESNDHEPTPVSPANVQVRVTVPLDTLLGLADNPGHLENYGPIDPELCRVLACDAEWIRWVTDPVADFLLDEGRRRYPGARLARFLRSREARCKHPSCGVSSRNCDADHLPDYADGGLTASSEMSPTCPRHNRNREASGWRTRQDGPRDRHGPPDPTWVSPLGREYHTAIHRPLPTDAYPRRQ